MSGYGAPLPSERSNPSVIRIGDRFAVTAWNTGGREAFESIDLGGPAGWERVRLPQTTGDAHRHPMILNAARIDDTRLLVAIGEHVPTDGGGWGFGGATSARVLELAALAWQREESLPYGLSVDTLVADGAGHLVAIENVSGPQALIVRDDAGAWHREEIPVPWSSPPSVVLPLEPGRVLITGWSDHAKAVVAVLGG